ncbi:MAG: endonuclease VII domain-containing protein [Chloroflexota bacterium]|nr:endonuclease VII domain-containing protein [Chloroflexota bacterium]
MDDLTAKRCRTCKNHLPVEAFTRDWSKPDGRSTRCRQCTQQYFRRYRSDNREHIANLLKRHGLARKYRLTPEQWAAMEASQDSKCAICQIAFDIGIPAHSPMVDHDHRTGQVRSLLCRRCNTMLGMAREQPAVLQAAIEYLNRWELES